MTKIGKILTILGIFLCALMVLGLLIFVVGLVLFAMLDELEYFAGYVALCGYFPVVNIMFLLDYLLMGVGALGIPVLIVGIILKSIKPSDKTAA